jgi:hypothetical protein
MKADIGSVIVATGLSLVAAALLCAGLYALFGKPSTHEAKKRKQHIVHGFEIGGGIILGIILTAGLVGGSQIAFGIVESPLVVSRGAGLLIAIAAFLLILRLVRLWAKYFTGWVGYSVLNGLLMVSSGHLPNNPAILVPRWWSISATVLAFVSALACVRFTKTNSLNRVDKAALMFWVLAFTVAIDVDSTHAAYRKQFGLAAMLLGCAGLLMAWFYDRGMHNHKRHRATKSHRLASEIQP